MTHADRKESRAFRRCRRRVFSIYSVASQQINIINSIRTNRLAYLCYGSGTPVRILRGTLSVATGHRWSVVLTQVPGGWV